MSKALIAALLGSALLGACASIPDGEPGAELYGRTIRAESRAGVSLLTFRRDGTVHARFGNNQVVGRWEVDDRRLCFRWGSAPRECWPYASPFPRGREVVITSDRGNRVEVTLQ